MWFSWYVALRFLREGRSQTLMIFGGAAVGVGVIIFLSALISGLQATLIAKTLGAQPHVVVRPRLRRTRPVFPAVAGQTHTLRHVQRAQQPLRSIAQWQRVERELAQVPGVTHVSPLVSGAGLAYYGRTRKSIALMGVDAARYRAMIPIAEKLIRGRYDVSGKQVLIGSTLADELGVNVGDRLRLVGADPAGDVFTVAGIFDLGVREVNLRWAVVSLRGAQTLLGLPGGVTDIQLRVRDLFAADAVATRIEGATGLVADSWIELNTQLLVGLRAQSNSSVMIQLFVFIAVALAIASVLIISVVQKSREIGIMRAYGVSRGQIARIFLVQGALVGIIGALLGALLGTGLALLFETMAVGPDGSPRFPVDLGWAIFARGTAVALTSGLLAAVFPARRAARLDPSEAMR
ncbi:MAG: ABC transporter permease [Deltaproteobacteria bacterium]|nr:ABC transporter permease [Deltaproteobacteria bacterium]